MLDEEPRLALLFTQVTIGFIDPIGPRRIEDIEVNRVFHGLGFVRHIWRDGEYLAGVHYNFFSIDIKLQTTPAPA
jgi:hypothetical protein